MRRFALLTIAVVAIALAGCDDGTATDGAAANGDAATAVEATALEQTGTAELDGDTIIVQLANGPVRLEPAADTTFFICQGDDCETVEEETFRAAVTDGSSIRVLGPNAELLGPDATELPGALWVVLDQDAD